MTITEYYKNYSTTKQFPNQLPNGCDRTIDDFYNNCIVKNLCPISNVLVWHKMFMDYLELPNAVFWIRYYESGSKANGQWSNRRACYSEFKDGFSYVFVSNYDVHEIFNMVYQGVTPDAEEFLNLMNSFKYPLHYDPGKKDDEEKRSSCEETAICAYPNIGSTRGGVITEKHWYLAHINAIKDGYLRPDGMIKKLSKQETNRIFPRGIVSDWKQDPSDGLMKRKLNYSLSQDEKKLVKAHFLRFVDPLNYFIVPGESYENHDHAIYNGNCIGEYKDLTEYVRHKFELLYGEQTVKDYRDKALIDTSYIVNVPGVSAQNINITYGSNLNTTNNSNSTSNSIKTNTITNKTNTQKTKTNKLKVTNKNTTTIMPNVHRIIAAEGNMSGSQDELRLLVSAPYLRQLAPAIIDRLYHQHQQLFINSICNNPIHAGEYDFDTLNRAFAEANIVTARQRRNGQSRYLNTVYNINNTSLYLNGDWYAISHANPRVTASWLSINDLIRVLNRCFNANFIYIVSDNEHQLWGPSGTL